MGLGNQVREIKAKDKTAKENLNRSATAISSGGYQGGPILSGSKEEQQGQLAGLNLGALGYGQGLGQTGEDIQRIRELQQDRTNQSGGDPVSAAIMGQKAGQVANAQRNMAQSGVKGGAAAGAISNIERAADADIAASLYGQQRQSIADERSLAGNTLAGTTALMQGEKAANVKAPAAPESGGMSVICTELFLQGYMPLETYLKDHSYGLYVQRNQPEVIVGYHFLANPVVKLMQKSPLFTKIISFPGMKWARHIAKEEENIFGHFITNVMQPMCAIIGKIKIKITGEKYVSIGNY